jgi:cystathionine gamma-synthase
VVNGVLATRRDDLAERLRFLQNAMGAVPGPFDCFLVLRGLRTLGIRTERHAANAAAVAGFLAGRDDIAWVSYPGLASGPHAHPQAALAARQMGRFGGMVSFAPAPGGRHGRDARERAIAICEGTRVFTLAESLGGVESLIEVPAIMTHASVAGSSLEVEDALIRLSVGIEAADDLVADLAHALDEA